MAWEPPGRNCGSCGVAECSAFITLARQGKKDLAACPYYPRRSPAGPVQAVPAPSGRDILGFDYDFVVRPFPGEPSARRFVQPLRADLAERWGIGPGDILRGRPVEPSCPIQHVLRVISVDLVTGILACHTVGPSVARESAKVHDIRAYHEIGFEGIADTVRHEPVVGFRMRFLPANCMRQLVHSGVVQMVLNKSFGTHVLIEDIQMHGKREKLKDITIRPGDSVSIEDASGTRKTVLIDGIRVHTSEGAILERSSGEGDHGSEHGQEKGRHRRHDQGGKRHHGDDDD
jgi:uncharacterized protein